MDDLIAFLRRCLDDDERVALAANSRNDWWTIGQLKQWMFFEDRAHIVCWDPQRVLAEVEAKRAILDAIERAMVEPSNPWADGACGFAEQTLDYLAQPYAGREGWREEWRVAA